MQMLLPLSDGLKYLLLLFFSFSPDKFNSPLFQNNVSDAGEEVGGFSVSSTCSGGQPTALGEGGVSSFFCQPYFLSYLFLSVFCLLQIMKYPLLWTSSKMDFLLELLRFVNKEALYYLVWKI